MTISDDLTSDERKAVSTLKRLAKRWPKSLWLFSASGDLHVMKCGPDGERVRNPHIPDAVDPDHVVETIKIPNDGGDW